MALIQERNGERRFRFRGNVIELALLLMAFVSVAAVSAIAAVSMAPFEDPPTSCREGHSTVPAPLANR